MRRRYLLFLCLVLAALVAVNCSKKRQAPTAPPPPSDPACSLSSALLSFGTVPVGSSADRSFILTNTGGGTLGGTATEGCAEFSLLGSSAFSLGAGQADTFTVRFAPVTEGAQTCTLRTGSSGARSSPAAARGR